MVIVAALMVSIERKQVRVAPVSCDVIEIGREENGVSS
jgi:hypothetical protein